VSDDKRLYDCFLCSPHGLHHFCFVLYFQVYFKIISVSVPWRIFLLFFSINFQLTTWLKVHTFFLWFILGAFWCCPGDSSEFWLCPWKFQLDYPVPLWEGFLRLWIFLAYHTSSGNGKFFCSNSAYTYLIQIQNVPIFKSS
jgi:hypothetical protein